MKKGQFHYIFLIVLVIVSAVLTTGCGKDTDKNNKEKKKKKEIILTTDFEENELFRIDGLSCYLPEVMVYLVNSENMYTDIFGEGIWSVKVGEKTIEEEYKEIILARIAQIKVMNLLAESEQYGISLDEEEEGKIANAAHIYFSSLSKSEIDLMGVNEEIIYNLYKEFAIANKLYHVITDEINPEISDDEARAVTVRSILIKTYTFDEEGNRIDYSEHEKAIALNKANEVLKKLEEGTEFDIIAADYNEDEQSEYSFGRGIMPKTFEDAAFDLDNGEISGIVETEYGYHILMCVSNYNREETDANKIKIVNSRKQEAFNDIYNEYVGKLTSNLNAPLWEGVEYTSSEGIDTVDFFDVFDENF